MLVLVVFVTVLAIPIFFIPGYGDSKASFLVGWAGSIAIAAYFARKFSNYKIWLLPILLLGAALLPFIFGNIELEKWGKSSNHIYE